MPTLGTNNVFAPKKPAWWMGLLLSTLVALSFYAETSKSIEHDANERFSNLARIAQNSIGAHVKSYADLLRSTASAFELTGVINRQQFHRYVDSLDLPAHFPAIETINYASFLTENERPALEAAMRREDHQGADGYPAFHIFPAGQRPTYSVLTLLEPINRVSHRFGADIAADTAGARAVEASRDAGAFINSGKPIRMSAKPDMVGVAMRIPVYRKGAPVSTLAERRAAFIGSVGIGFDLQTLLQQVRQELPVHQMRVALFESSDTAPRQARITADDHLLIDTGDVGAAAARWWPLLCAGRPFATVLLIDYNGHLWKGYFSAKREALYTRFDAYFPWLAMLAGFISTMLIFVLFHTLAASRLHALHLAREMTQELRDSQVRLQRSNYKLRRLAAHAEQIKEEERKRIAREIHDDLGQNLLVLRIEADMLATRTSYKHGRLHARARATLGQIDATIKSVRQIINDLRPNVLDLGLNAAVEWQISEFRRRTGIVCEFNDAQPDLRVSDQCATAFFRVLQESLSNITQHASASLVQVDLRQEGQYLSMRVRDNGIGMQRGGRHKVTSFGLVGIDERMQILGGKLDINSAPGCGTTVHISVPIDVEQPDAGAPHRDAEHAMQR
jgi:signal transduction histidine kinase/CHASE1-domain containing sensor protein